MLPPVYVKTLFTVLFLLIFRVADCDAQCSPATGAPPPKEFFHTGGNNPGQPDSKWMVATDSVNGLYKPAVIMDGLSSQYYNAQTWLSFSATGEHPGSIYLFFKLEFSLPCADPCGTSYNVDGAYCLNLDLYADNSVFEIYVNGVPQGSNLANVPLPNPFNPNLTPKDKTAVSLCKNWKAGQNSIVIQLASSATVAGLLVEASPGTPPAPNADTLAVSICEGEQYNLGSQVLTKTGYYFETFTSPGGCDSSLVINLSVKPSASVVINQTICAGEIFLGFDRTGTYTTRYSGANGCDSIRTVNLVVQDKPVPILPQRNILCQGDSLVLNPGQFLSYAWQDGSTNPTLIVKKAGGYAVTVTNSCGSTTREVLVEDGFCTVYFPSAFTPNNDGKNDRFKVLTNGVLLDFHLTVFNRWGEIVYDSRDAAAGWDGTINGVKQPPGGFAWRCSFTSTNCPVERTGKVVLLR